MKYRLNLVMICILLFGVVGCAGDPLFGPIGVNMSNPLTIAVNSTTKRAYVNNSNSKFIYDGGSLHVVDLTTITAPTRLATIGINSFNGNMFLDSTANKLYVPNRLSDNDADDIDTLFSINTNEASSTFLSVSSVEADGDPFDILPGKNATELLVPSQEGFLDIFDISGATPNRISQLDLKQELSDGSTLSYVDATQAVVINSGAQAVITRAIGGLLVVNLNEIGGSGKPIDYYIPDLVSPRGIATQGGASTIVYVVDVIDEGTKDEQNVLYVLDLASLAPDTTNAAITIKDKDTDGLLTNTIGLGDNPQQVLFSSTLNQLFVSNTDSDTISVIRTNNLAGGVKATITVGDEPFGMAFYQQTVGTDSHLLVCNQEGNTVSIVDLATNSIVATYP